VLASNVGEASVVLPSEMLVEYEGSLDARYAEKLALRVQGLLSEPQTFRSAHLLSSGIAAKHFNYSALLVPLKRVLRAVLPPSAVRDKSRTA